MYVIAAGRDHAASGSILPNSNTGEGTQMFEIIVRVLQKRGYRAFARAPALSYPRHAGLRQGGMNPLSAPGFPP
tara:strand:- start:148 stop:369 length:222 start_codon:yes stop_codon:yes gene_type:complete